jgi:N-alpha-acetyl-L-2,4-diaminobutyrate deacetylase
LQIAPTTQLDMPDDSCFLFSQTAGLIEYLAELGDHVKAGQPVARIWASDRTGVAPLECYALRSGILTARHVPGLVKVGDFMSLIAKEVS